MPDPVTRAEDTVTLDSSPTMAMTSLYGAAIGPIGCDYYLPIFNRFEARGQATLSWNWSACLFNLNWMIFRGLWGAVLAAVGTLLGAALVLVALGNLVFDWPTDVLVGMLLACLTLFCLVPGAWGNALFYNHSRAAMMTAVANNKTLTQACAELSQHASSRARLLRLLAVNAALAAAAGVAYVMLTDNDAPGSPAPGSVSALDSAPSPASTVSAPVPVASAPDEVASAAAAAASDAASAGTAAGTAAATSEPASAPPSAMASAAAETHPPSATTSVSESVATANASTATVVAPVQQVSHTGADKPLMKAAKPAALAPSAVPATPPVKGFYVNAGLFANPDNARNALARLQAAGLPALAQELETSQGTRTRLRVGPFAKRTQAEAAVRQIKGLKLDAALVKP